MNTIFMNSENSKISLSDKMNLKRSNKYVALSDISIYYTWKNIKKSCKNNKFKISTPTWNENFGLPDGSYSISNIQVYLEYIMKKQKQLTRGVL